MKTYARKGKEPANDVSGLPPEGVMGAATGPGWGTMNSIPPRRDPVLIPPIPVPSGCQPSPPADPYDFNVHDSGGAATLVIQSSKRSHTSGQLPSPAAQHSAPLSTAKRTLGGTCQARSCGAPTGDPWDPVFVDDPQIAAQSQHDPVFLRALMESSAAGASDGSSGGSLQNSAPPGRRRSFSQPQPRASSLSQGLQGHLQDDPKAVSAVAARVGSGARLTSVPAGGGDWAARQGSGAAAAAATGGVAGSQEDASLYGEPCSNLVDSQASTTNSTGKPPLSRPTARVLLRREGGSGSQVPLDGGVLAAAAAEAKRASSLHNKSAKGSGLKAPELEKSGSGSLNRKQSSSAALELRPAKRSGSSGGSARSNGGGTGGVPKPAGVAAASAMLQRRKSAAVDTVAARTVVEAEESGENTQLLDDALYALQGLAVGASVATRQDCVLTLTDIAATQRGRRTLRCGGVLVEALEAAPGLQLAEHPLLALLYATLLASFGRQPADQDALATPQALAVFGLLAKVEGEAEAGSECAARASKLVQGACGVPAAYCRSASFVALTVLAGATDPHRSPTTADGLKHALRAGGLLTQLIAAAAESVCACCPPAAGAAVRDAAHTRRLQAQLQPLLVTLENTTFACPENEQHLVRVSVPGAVQCPAQGSAQGSVQRAAGAPSSDGGGFCGWLTARLPEMARAAREGRMPRQCMHSALSLLMNVTHNSEVGREAVAAAGGVAIVGRMMAAAASAQLPGCGPGRGGTGAGGVEVLSVLLGLLINLVETSPENRAELVALDLGEDEGAPPGGLLPLLCRMISSSATTEPESEGSSQRLQSGEMTEEQLEGREGAGDASILEVYASMMLGFLVADEPERQQEAEALLPGGSLGPVAAAVERALHFYVNTGSITAAAAASLRRLVAALREGSPSQADGEQTP